MRPKLDKSVVFDLRTTGQLMQPVCRKPFSFCSAVLTEFTFRRPYSVSYGCCPGCYSIILDVTTPSPLLILLFNGGDGNLAQFSVQKTVEFDDFVTNL